MRNFIFIVACLFLMSCSQSNYSKYGPMYESEVLSEVPDYSNISYWAAHPDKKDPSDSVPKNVVSNQLQTKEVDVFFVYPTSYLDRTLPYGYNAPIKESKINIYTDYTAILYQASVFNEVGKIYAPRYRQANSCAYPAPSCAPPHSSL